MRQISEKNLALFINLLASKLAQLQEEYAGAKKILINWLMLKLKICIRFRN